MIVPRTPPTKATGAGLWGDRIQARITASRGGISPGIAIPTLGTGRAKNFVVMDIITIAMRVEIKGARVRRI